MFFVSEAESFITGQVISASGGLTMAACPFEGTQASPAFDRYNLLVLDASLPSDKIVVRDAGRKFPQSMSPIYCRLVRNR